MNEAIVDDDMYEDTKFYMTQRAQALLPQATESTKSLILQSALEAEVAMYVNKYDEDSSSSTLNVLNCVSICILIIIHLNYL